MPLDTPGISLIQIHHQILLIGNDYNGFWIIPGHQQGVRYKTPRECRLRLTCSTPQGETTEGNTVDDILIVDQGLTEKFGINILDVLNKA